MTYLFANWKMYLHHQEALALAQQLAHTTSSADTTITIFPTALSFLSVQEALATTNISCGVQNISWTPQGAYTGALSAHLAKDVGARYALVGHSERRYIFGESDSDVRKKIDAALESGMIPVVCIGETQEDVEAGKTAYRLKKQLMMAFEGLMLSDNQLIVAYEPVWAISQSGKGIACDPLQAEEQHAFIAEEIKRYTTAQVPLIYGGSVTADNVLSYISCHHIDGVLVGSASTRLESMSALIQAVTSK